MASWDDKGMTCTHLFVMCARGSREAASYGSEVARARRCMPTLRQSLRDDYSDHHRMVTLITSTHSRTYMTHVLAYSLTVRAEQHELPELKLSTVDQARPVHVLL